MSESHPGQGAAGTTTDSDGNSSNECPACPKSYSETTDLTRHMRSCCPNKLEPCPTCGKRYSSNRGVKLHHKRTHGESLAKHTKPCDNCGEPTEVWDYELERQAHHFCDTPCAAEYQKDRIPMDCEICGSDMSVIPSRKDIAACCSPSCRVEKTRRITGSDRYNYKTEEYDCWQCGAVVERSPSMVYSPDRVFCGDGCFDKFRRSDYSTYYGENWEQQRQKALDRDHHRCQLCSVPRSNLHREPDVHHIQPIDTFRDKFDEPEWWERANRLSNLVCLCPSCHGEMEKFAPLLPEFV